MYEHRCQIGVRSNLIFAKIFVGKAAILFRNDQIEIVGENIGENQAD